MRSEIFTCLFKSLSTCTVYQFLCRIYQSLYIYILYDFICMYDMCYVLFYVCVRSDTWIKLNRIELKPLGVGGVYMHFTCTKPRPRLCLDPL